MLDVFSQAGGDIIVDSEVRQIPWCVCFSAIHTKCRGRQSRGQWLQVMQDLGSTWLCFTTSSVSSVIMDQGRSTPSTAAMYGYGEQTSERQWLLASFIECPCTLVSYSSPRRGWEIYNQWKISDEGTRKMIHGESTGNTGTVKSLWEGHYFSVWRFSSNRSIGETKWLDQGYGLEQQKPRRQWTNPRCKHACSGGPGWGPVEEPHRSRGLGIPRLVEEGRQDWEVGRKGWDNKRQFQVDRGRAVTSAQCFQAWLHLGGKEAHNAEVGV